MDYVDGFVIAVPTAKREAYRQLAQDASAVFKDHGALHVVECWGDDVPEGKVTSFPMAVQRKPDETVVFSWIVWPSRQVRDEGMKKSMEDPRMNHDPKNMPFDGQRMIFGGFEVIVEALGRVDEMSPDAPDANALQRIDRPRQRAYDFSIGQETLDPLSSGARPLRRRQSNCSIQEA